MGSFVGGLASVQEPPHLWSEWLAGALRQLCRLAAESSRLGAGVASDIPQALGYSPGEEGGALAMLGGHRCSTTPRAPASASHAASGHGPRGEPPTGLHSCTTSCPYCLFPVTQGQAYLQEDAAAGGAGAGNEVQSDGKGDASRQ